MPLEPISSIATIPRPEIRFRMGYFDTPVPTNWYDGFTSANGNVSVLGICKPYQATLIFGTGQVFSDLGNESASARWSMGYLHTQLGVGQLDAGIGTTSEDNVSPTAVVVDDRLYGQSQLVIRDTAHSTFPVVGFASIVDISSFPDPPEFRTLVQILGDNTETKRYRGFVVSITGFDASHCENRIGLGSGTSPLTMDCTGLLVGSAPPYWENTPTTTVPHCTICLSSGYNLFQHSEYHIQIGVSHRDGTQYSLTQTEANGVAAGQPVASFRNDCIAHRLDPASGNLTYKVVVDNWTDTSFDITPSADASDAVLHLLTFGFDNIDNSKIITFDTPLATGNVSYTGVGFTPQFGLLIASSLETFNTPQFNTALAGGVQISAIGSVAGNLTQHANSVRIKAGANPTDTASRSVIKALSIPSDSASDVIVATLVSMDADGFTLNYSAVAASAKKVVAFLVEETEVACDINGTIYFEKQDPIGNLIGPSTFLLHSETLGNFTIIDNFVSGFGAQYDYGNVTGQFQVIGVPPGNYTLTETAAPDGYSLDSTPILITVGALDEVILDPIINLPLTFALIEKRDENGNLVPGATYSIVAEGGGEPYVVEDGGENDSDPMPGRVLVIGLLPGDYIVTETVPPDGYQLDPVPKAVTVTLGNVSSTGIAGEVDAGDFVDEITEAEAAIATPYTLCKVVNSSFVEMGPFRFAEQKQADETSMISSLIVGLSPEQNAEIIFIDWSDDDTGDEDWLDMTSIDGEDILENWGDGSELQDAFELKLIAMDDGSFSQFQGPEILEPFEDLGATRQYAPLGFSGIWHKIRLSTKDVGDSFYLKFIDIAGSLTGRHK